jgi:hypothetical protein
MEPWAFGEGTNTKSLLTPKQPPKRPDEVQHHFPKDTPKNVVLTSWLTYAKDPQRGNQVSAESIDYIYNLYTSATYLKVSLVVFHDGLSEELVDTYSNQWVTFKRVAPSMTYSTNDYRLKLYNNYLQEHDFGSVLMADASDVFFNADPFEHMHQHGQDRSLFIGIDTGFKRFDQTAYMVPTCFGNQGSAWDQNKPMYNAGVWGGRVDVVRCLLICVSQQLGGPLRGKGNCNMPALNWCISHGPCSTDLVIEPSTPARSSQGAAATSTKPPNAVQHMSPTCLPPHVTHRLNTLILIITTTLLGFLNPWAQGCLTKCKKGADTCTQKHSVVHNKCAGTVGKVCVEIVGGNIKLLYTGAGMVWWQKTMCAEFMERKQTVHHLDALVTRLEFVGGNIKFGAKLPSTEVNREDVRQAQELLQKREEEQKGVRQAQELLQKWEEAHASRPSTAEAAPAATPAKAATNTLMALIKWVKAGAKVPVNIPSTEVHRDDVRQTQELLQKWEEAHTNSSSPSAAETAPAVTTAGAAAPLSEAIPPAESVPPEESMG